MKKENGMYLMPRTADTEKVGYISMSTKYQNVIFKLKKFQLAFAARQWKHFKNVERTRSLREQPASMNIHSAADLHTILRVASSPNTIRSSREIMIFWKLAFSSEKT